MILSAAGLVAVVDVEDDVGALRHLFQEVPRDPFVVGDEAVELGVAHHPEGRASRTRARDPHSQLLFLQSPPLVYPFHTFDAQHDLYVYTVEEGAVGSGQGPVHRSTPPAAGVLFAFERVDRLRERGRGLGPGSNAPALEEHVAGTSIVPGPCAARPAVVGRLVEGGQRGALPRTLGEQTFDCVDSQRRVMGAGRAAGREEGVHFAAEALTLGVGEVEVVHRQHGGPGAESFVQHRPEQDADRRLSGSLPSGEPHYDCAAGSRPRALQPGGERQVHRPEPRPEVGVDRHRLACTEEGRPARSLSAREFRFGEKSLPSGPLDGGAHGAALKHCAPEGSRGGTSGDRFSTGDARVSPPRMPGRRASMPIRARGRFPCWPGHGKLCHRAPWNARRRWTGACPCSSFCDLGARLRPCYRRRGCVPDDIPPPPRRARR